MKTVLCALNYYTLREMRGIIDYAGTAGWHLEIPEALYLKETLRRWTGDGIITDIPLERRYKTQGIKTVSILRYNTGQYADCFVLPDNRELGRKAAEYFLRHGYRNFVVCSEPLGRDHGFEQEINLHGHQVVRVGPFTQAGTPFKEFEGVFEKIKCPCGVFCNNDLVAVRFLNAALAHGLRVPEDVAVLGVGNEELYCRATNPPLSSINSRLYERGRRAALELDRLFQGGPATAEPILIAPADVIERGSTNFYAVDNSQVREMINYVLANAAGPLNISDLSGLFYKTESAIYRCFLKALGVTPKDFLTEVRLTLARNRLIETNDKLTVIAEECGFPNDGAMYAAFRKHCGQTPLEWRSRNRDIISL